MNHDNGMARAQREYDRQEPPEPNYTDCEQCEGKGKLLVDGEKVTACCLVEFIDGINVCSKCGEETQAEDCHECEGTGRV